MRRRAEMQLRLAQLRREDDTAVGADPVVAAVQRLEIVGEHPALQQQRVLGIFHRHTDAPGEAERIGKRRALDKAGVVAARQFLETLEIIMLADRQFRSEEHTSELQSLMRISYAVFCLKKK